MIASRTPFLKQKGFNFIEFGFVIFIIGILTVFASTKFLELKRHIIKVEAQLVAINLEIASVVYYMKSGDKIHVNNCTDIVKIMPEDYKFPTGFVVKSKPIDFSSTTICELIHPDGVTKVKFNMLPS